MGLTNYRRVLTIKFKGSKEKERKIYHTREQGNSHYDFISLRRIQKFGTFLSGSCLGTYEKGASSNDLLPQIELQKKVSIPSLFVKIYKRISEGFSEIKAIQGKTYFSNFLSMGYISTTKIKKNCLMLLQDKIMLRKKA
ncbi:hypothetical protein CMU93_05190 [Elizabethkingia anophelis]|nr:hypothetical protein [Elizabethkingia anophelis]